MFISGVGTKYETRRYLGTDVLRIGVCLPELPDKLTDIYRSLVQKASEEAESRLFEIASEEFDIHRSDVSLRYRPFEKYNYFLGIEITHEDDKYLSIIQTVSIMKGRKKVFFRRYAQVWSKEEETILSLWEMKRCFSLGKLPIRAYDGAFLRGEEVVLFGNGKNGEEYSEKIVPICCIK